jgi:hypothetical protein
MSSTYTSTPSTTYGVVDQARAKSQASAWWRGLWYSGLGEHDHAVAEHHVHLGDMSVCVGPASGLAKAKGLGDPIGGAGNVLVGDHRDSAGHGAECVGHGGSFRRSDHPSRPVCHPAQASFETLCRVEPRGRQGVKLGTRPGVTVPLTSRLSLSSTGSAKTASSRRRSQEGCSVPCCLLPSQPASRPGATDLGAQTKMCPGRVLRCPPRR